MAISPRSPEQAARRYWAISVIRIFGILQVISGAFLSYLFLQRTISVLLVSTGITSDTADVIAMFLAVALGLLAGFAMAAMTFAIATAFDDLHAIRYYLRDMTLTGQYYDD